MSKSEPGRATGKLPTKWAVAILFALVGYALLQPVANSKMGWHLPSVASLLGQAGQPATDSQPTSTSNTGDRASSAQSKSAADSEAVETAKVQDPEPPTATGSSSNESDTETLLHGYLREISSDVYLSPAGLRYTPMGPPEMHRLAHVERHLTDDPDRPSRHGVFDGDMAQVLRWIDDAYKRGKGGAKGTRKKTEGDRTVYEATFSKPIGYVGGRVGKRENHPDARKLRLVVEGTRVITAFPF